MKARRGQSRCRSNSLVHLQDRFLLTGYSIVHENSNLRTYALSEEERERLREALRSRDTFTMRRAQILLASCRGERAPKIALNLGGAPRKRPATP